LYFELSRLQTTWPEWGHHFCFYKQVAWQQSVIKCKTHEKQFAMILVMHLTLQAHSLNLIQ